MEKRILDLLKDVKRYCWGQSCETCPLGKKICDRDEHLDLSHIKNQEPKKAEDRNLIAAMMLISKHCQEAEAGTCTKCLFHKKDKGCVLARYFPNGWAGHMEEEQ